MSFWFTSASESVAVGRASATRQRFCCSGDNRSHSHKARAFPLADRSPSVDPTLPSSGEGSKKVFVVYGHDDVACEQLELLLHRLDLDPFVLGNTSGGGLTIIEALEREIVSPSKGMRFGIVLLTPDLRFRALLCSEAPYPLGAPVLEISA